MPWIRIDWVNGKNNGYNRPAVALSVVGLTVHEFCLSLSNLHHITVHGGFAKTGHSYLGNLWLYHGCEHRLLKLCWWTSRSLHEWLAGRHQNISSISSVAVVCSHLSFRRKEDWKIWTSGRVWKWVAGCNNLYINPLVLNGLTDERYILACCQQMFFQRSIPGVHSNTQ